MNAELQRLKQSPLHIIFMLFAFVGVVLIFLLQQTDVLGFICQCKFGLNAHFVFNKTLRLIGNDVFMIVIIHYWFHKKKITRLALWIQVIDVFILLPVYLSAKLLIEGNSELSSPLLSQFHRLIVNPTLMVLMFPAVYFQRLKGDNTYE